LVVDIMFLKFFDVGCMMSDLCWSISRWCFNILANSDRRSL